MEFLTKREVKSLNAGIKKFDLKSPVFYLSLLPDELIETRLANLAGAVRCGIRSTILAGRLPVQCHPKANGPSVFRRT